VQATSEPRRANIAMPIEVNSIEPVETNRYPAKGDPNVIPMF
jgi:hypothetical protein